MLAILDHGRWASIVCERDPKPGNFTYLPCPENLVQTLSKLPHPVIPAKKVWRDGPRSLTHRRALQAPMDFQNRSGLGAQSRLITGE
jgi:hypothetical protein